MPPAMTAAATPDIKAPGVAGGFYPADPGALAGQVSSCIKVGQRFGMAPKALIAPHAGYLFSGTIAGTAYANVAHLRGTVKRVVLLSPPHRMPVAKIARATHSHWQSPLGALPTDLAALDDLQTLPVVTTDNAPFVQEHGLEVHFPFIQQVFGPHTQVVPLLVGGATPTEVATVLDRLWGGPETLIIISSDLSHFLDIDSARAMDAEATAAIERLRPDALTEPQACGHHAARGLLLAARQRGLRATNLDLRNSGDTAGTPARVVGYGAYAFEDATTARLPDNLRSTLLDVARKVVHAAAEQGKPVGIQPRGLQRPMLAQRGTFVTPKHNGRLRGCIGSTQAIQPLIHDVAANAAKSTLKDPRFAPVSKDEAASLTLSIAILSEQQPLPVASEAELLDTLIPGRDGLVLRDGDKGALFLPQVWDEIPDPRQFVGRLKQKADLAPEHWSPTMRCFRFVAETFGEH